MRSLKECLLNEVRITIHNAKVPTFDPSKAPVFIDIKARGFIYYYNSKENSIQKLKVKSVRKITDPYAVGETWYSDYMEYMPEKDITWWKLKDLKEFKFDVDPLSPVYLGKLLPTYLSCVFSVHGSRFEIIATTQEEIEIAIQEIKSKL